MRIRNNRVSQPLKTVEGNKAGDGSVSSSLSSSSEPGILGADGEFFIYCSEQDQQQKQQEQLLNDEPKLRNVMHSMLKQTTLRIRNNCVSQPLLAIGDHTKINIITVPNGSCASSVSSLTFFPIPHPLPKRNSSQSTTNRHLSIHGSQSHGGSLQELQKENSVSFSKVHILECPLEYDDSNLMTQYPLRLGAPFKQITMSVDKFESKHKQQQQHREASPFNEEEKLEDEFDTNEEENNNNKKSQCELSPLERKELLMTCGNYTEEDIEGMERVRKIQWAKQRLHSKKRQSQNSTK